MLWHITKRELYDHINSLWFALTMLLILALMVMNAIGYLGNDYRAQIGAYRINVASSRNDLESRTHSLYNLLRTGPGKLYKKPSTLTFCAYGGEAFLPKYTEGTFRYGHWESWLWQGQRFYYSHEDLWRMNYPQSNPNLRNVMPDFMAIDWAFVISVALSFVAILFTFDAISGERQRGTLRLILSNSVPRDTLLLAKFLGAFISIGIPFLMAVLINLIILSTYGKEHIQLSASEWIRIGAIVLIAFLYTAIFIALSILVSSRARDSSVSLMILLLIWVILVILTPTTVGSIITSVKPAMTRDEFRARQSGLNANLEGEYRSRRSGIPSRDTPPTKVTSLWAEYIREEATRSEKLNEQHVKAQISQIQRARSMTRVSPAAIVQYAIEALAGTGFPRHLQFLEQVHRYAAEFRQFLVETDRADSESSHAIGVAEGTSGKPVNFEAIPKFEDRVTFSGSLNDATVDILLLVLFLVVLFAGAYLSFLRAEL